MRYTSVVATLLLAIWAVPAAAQLERPTLSIIEPRAGVTYPPSIQLFFESDGALFECRVDAQVYPCAPGTVNLITGLANGDHHVHVMATSVSGAVVQNSLPFFVDAVAPTLSDVFPAGLVGPNVSAFFTSDDPSAAFECSVDGIQYECRPGVPFALSALFDGPHMLQIAATDPYGNRNNFESFFEVDSRGPVFDAAATRVPATAVCPRSTVDTQILFLAQDRSNPVEYRCSVDGGALRPCDLFNGAEPRFAWRCLAHGPHQVSVIASDRFGNTSQPLQLPFSVTRPPTCPVDACAGPDLTVTDGSSFALDGSLSTGDTFLWTQVAGPFAFIPEFWAPSPQVTAPTLPGGVGTQVVSFMLTVGSTASGIQETDRVDVTVRNVNLAPVADAGADQSVREGRPVRLSGRISYDPDGDAIATYEWMQIDGPAVVLSSPGAAEPTFTAPLLSGGVGGSHLLRFQLRVSDSELFSTPDFVVVTVEQDNHAPVADAGADQTVNEGTQVTLRGAGSADPDGDALRYSWTQVAGTPVALQGGNTPMPAFIAPAVASGVQETLQFRLEVSDGALGGADVVSVHVRDTNDPPSCALARASRDHLWPPNHKLVPITIVGVTDANDAVTIRISGVTQDEPVNGTGSGDTAPDAVIQPDGSVLLRGERDGAGDGRVYHVGFVADDGQGGSCTGSVRVLVPHNARATSVGDGGSLHDSTLR